MQLKAELGAILPLGDRERHEQHPKAAHAVRACTRGGREKERATVKTESCPTMHIPGRPASMAEQHALTISCVCMQQSPGRISHGLAG